MKLTYWVCESLTECKFDILDKTKRGATLAREAEYDPTRFLPVAKRTVLYVDAFDLLSRALKGCIQ